jgi:hypothetical protein
VPAETVASHSAEAKNQEPHSKQKEKFYDRLRKWYRKWAGPYLGAAILAASLSFATHAALAQTQRFSRWQYLLYAVFAVACFLKPKIASLVGTYLLGMVVSLTFLWNAWDPKAPLTTAIRLVLTVALLVLYYRAETLELAFTQLRGKDDTLLEEGDRELVQNISHHQEVFYEAREWFVVAIVIGLTLLSDFKNFSLPFFAIGDNEWFRLGMSILFTTVVVLWLCQSPAKARALRDPLGTLRAREKMWIWVRRVGMLMDKGGLFQPGERFSEFQNFLYPVNDTDKDLRPSDQSFYHACLKRYGHSIHDLFEELDLYSDGSARLKQTGVIYVVRGNKKQFPRWFFFDKHIRTDVGSFVVDPAVTSWAIHNFGERLSDKANRQLAMLFNGEFKELIEAKVGVRGELKLRVEKKEGAGGVTEEVTDPQRADFTITSRDPLPEGFEHPDKERKRRKKEPAESAVGIRFEVELYAEKGAYKLNEGNTVELTADYMFKSFEFPCKNYKLIIKLLNDKSTHEWAGAEREAFLLRAPHPLEKDRIKIEFKGSTELHATIEYPMPGIRYNIDLSIRRLAQGHAAAPAKNG